MLRYRNTHHAGEGHRHRVPDLTHSLTPWSLELVAIREALDTRALANREIPISAVRPDKHVLAARNAVDSRLHRLSRPVDRIPGVPMVETSAWDANVVRNGGIGVVINRLRKIL